MRSFRRGLAAGAVAGPLFGAAFTAIGALRSDYDWRRHAVSSLAHGRAGWWQRANFIATGALWCSAARALKMDSSPVSRRQLVAALVGAAGVGLIGSGLFVTDQVGDPPSPQPIGEHENGAGVSPKPTRAGRLHNLSAIPVFAGIPVAGLADAISATRVGGYGWACYSAGSSLGMVGSFVLCGAAFAGKSQLVGFGGLFQRISIAFGFGWVTALCVRAMRGACGRKP